MTWCGIVTVPKTRFKPSISDFEAFTRLTNITQFGGFCPKFIDFVRE